MEGVTHSPSKGSLLQEENSLGNGNFSNEAPVNRGDHFHHSTHLSPSHRQPCRAAGPQRRGTRQNSPLLEDRE